MATLSSVLAWRIPWTEEPGGYSPLGPHRVGRGWSDWAPHGPGRFAGSPSHRGVPLATWWTQPELIAKCGPDTWPKCVPSSAEQMPLPQAGRCPPFSRAHTREAQRTARSEPQAGGSQAASAGGSAPNAEVSVAPRGRKALGRWRLRAGESARQPQLRQLSRSAIQAASCVRQRVPAPLMLPGAPCGMEKGVCVCDVCARGI